MMKQSKRNTGQRQGGFTLIELLIVVAIIGVLAAIAVPRYQDYVARSEFSAGLATLKGIQTPVEIYIQENGDITTSNSLDAMGIIDTASTESDAVPGAVSISGDNSISYTFNSGRLSPNNTITLARATEGGWGCTTTVNNENIVPDSCVYEAKEEAEQ